MTDQQYEHWQTLPPETQRMLLGVLVETAQYIFADVSCTCRVDPKRCRFCRLRSVLARLEGRLSSGSWEIVVR